MQPQSRVVCQRTPAKASEDAWIPTCPRKDEHRKGSGRVHFTKHGVTRTSEQLNRIDDASGCCLPPHAVASGAGPFAVVATRQDQQGPKTLPLFHFNRQSRPWKQSTFALLQIAV